MIAAFVKAFSQISEPSFRRVFWFGVLGSIAIFVLSWVILDFALERLDLPVLNLLVYEFDLDDIKDVFGGIAVVVLAGLLFPATVTLVVSFFLEDIAEAVDARHYPHLPPARPQSLAEILAITVKFLVIAVTLNILALPLLLALIFSPLYPFVFYALNGYLLGREYFELVVFRRVEPEDARALRKSRSGSLFVAGVVVAILLTVPVINLLVPVVATAAMVHLIEQWRGTNSV